jgi:hypothetical protein
MNRRMVFCAGNLKKSKGCLKNAQRSMIIGARATTCDVTGLPGGAGREAQDILQAAACGASAEKRE